MSANDDKRIHSINSIEKYAYEISKDLVCKNEEIKCKNIKQYKTINLDDVKKENIKEDDQNWSQIADHPYWILIISRSELGKTNTLLNLINHQPDIDKIYLYNKDSYEAKYWLSVNKQKSASRQNEYDPYKKCKILILFNNMMICWYALQEQTSTNYNRISYYHR